MMTQCVPSASPRAERLRGRRRDQATLHRCARVGVVLWCLLVAAIIALFFGSSRRVAVAAIVVVLLLVVVRAETPFGIGNGTVRDLVGLDECTATDKLAARELRWRFGRAPIGGRPAACIDTGGGVGSVADEIVGQRPAFGTRLTQ